MDGFIACFDGLEDPRTGERRGFADLNSLFAFLNNTCREPEHND